MYADLWPMRRGFSLLELLIVLMLLASLLLLAIPAGQDFSQKNRTMAQIQTLSAALYYARSEAILRNEKLVLCKSADAKHCGGQWQDGQILLDTTGQVLRVFSRLPKTDKLIWNSSGGQDNAITWLPSGYSNGQRGSFYYCTANSRNYSRAVVVFDTGRVYVTPINLADYRHYCLQS